MDATSSAICRTIRVQMILDLTVEMLSAAIRACTDLKVVFAPIAYSCIKHQITNR